MKKIYNKKGFKSGVFFFILAIIGTITISLRFNSLDDLKIIKSIIINTVCFLLAITKIYRSLSFKYSDEDDREEDERGELVTLKAQSTSFMICFIVCMAISVLLILAYVVKRLEVFLYLYIPFGIMSGIMFITVIVTTLYYESKC